VGIPVFIINYLLLNFINNWFGLIIN
jgi:hypothetical protein